MLNRNVYTFLGCEAEYADADIVVFGAPFDSTTSNRPGARFASAAMRQESYGLETYSPYQDADMADYSVFDGGDLELCFGDARLALDSIEEFAAGVLEDCKLPLMIGGEHLVTLGAVRAAVKRYPELCVVHFDAHADLRDEYLGTKLSHAAVLRRVWELTGDGRIHQFGIRSGDRSEFEWGKQHVFTQKFTLDGIESTARALEGKPVYLTIDLDVLDSSAFPGTGTPEAGGMTFVQLIDAVFKLRGLNIVAADINELCPMLDNSGVSTATACKVLRETLLMLLQSREEKRG